MLCWNLKRLLMPSSTIKFVQNLSKAYSKLSSGYLVFGKIKKLKFFMHFVFNLVKMFSKGCGII